jgi:hypothetical protein
MSEPSMVLVEGHAAIAELAAVVVNARAGSGGPGRPGTQLEMAEMDLLSARDAIEKACWEIDLASPTSADVRWPGAVGEPGRAAECGTLGQPGLRRCRAALPA